MALEKFHPTCFSIPFGRGFDSVATKGISDRAAGAFVSQVGQRTLNSPVTPPVGSRNGRDELSSRANGTQSHTLPVFPQ
jgi:hypothetical protein